MSKYYDVDMRYFFRLLSLLFKADFYFFQNIKCYLESIKEVEAQAEALGISTGCAPDKQLCVLRNKGKLSAMGGYSPCRQG